MYIQSISHLNTLRIYVCVQFLIITSIINNIFDFVHGMTTYITITKLSVHVRLKYFNAWNFYLTRSLTSALAMMEIFYLLLVTTISAY